MRERHDMGQSKTRRLHAAQGVDAANFGTESFPVDATRTVEVPAEAVDSLTRVGGFTPDDAPMPAPDGHVEADHDDATASFSMAGETFARGKDGRLFVPLAAVPHLPAHGFRLVPPVATENAPADAADDA